MMVSHPRYIIDENGCWVATVKRVFDLRRSIYEAHNGTIFKPLRMTCATVGCVNPLHAELTTRSEIAKAVASDRPHSGKNFKRKLRVV